MTADPGDAEQPPRVVVDVGGYRAADLVLVGVLGRLRLVTGRLGLGLVVVGASPELEQLLAFTGLRAVVPLAPHGASERGRQPESSEEPRVEEVVDVGDPAVTQLEDLDAPRLQPPTRTGLVLGEGG